jgi:hypothetical protein
MTENRSYITADLGHAGAATGITNHYSYRKAMARGAGDPLSSHKFNGIVKSAVLDRGRFTTQTGPAGQQTVAVDTTISHGL